MVLIHRVDAAQQFDSTTKAKMVDVAIKYRQLEKNTAPVSGIDLASVLRCNESIQDFSVSPPKGRNSVFCQKAPKHKELVGLVQAQDKTNDPDLFVDPITGQTIKKGDRADTFPFGTRLHLFLYAMSPSDMTSEVRNRVRH